MPRASGLDPHEGGDAVLRRNCNDRSSQQRRSLNRPRHRRSEGALDAEEHGNGLFPDRVLLAEMRANAADALEPQAEGICPRYPKGLGAAPLPLPYP